MRDAERTTKAGRPRISQLPRAEQLRVAKRRQRARERDAGMTKVELNLPRDEAARLKVVKNDPRFEPALQALLDEYVVDLKRWPALRELGWNRVDRWIPAAEALALYERNWRLIDKELDEKERAFVGNLAKRFGGGHLNV